MPRTTPSLLLIILALTAGFDSQTVAEPRDSLPEGATVVGLEIYPEKIALEDRYNYRQVLVTGVLADGQKIDVTRMVDVKAPPSVNVSDHAVVRPHADGSGEIQFAIGDQSVALPFTVTGHATQPKMSFVRDIMPALSRTGCSNGTCHGSQKGKNGFKLSLRGYDAEFDHRAIIDDLAGRRFNRAAPDRSLFLMKASGAVPHVGGVLFSPGEPYYDMLRSWITDGVELDLDTPRVTSIEVLPKDPVIDLPGQSQQLAVIATHADGLVRDVTAEAFIDAGNIEVTRVDRHGVVTALRRGESAMLVRYEGQYAVTQIFVMGDREGFEWKESPQYNYVDELADKKLERIKALPSPICTDEEFVRRVQLDLTGLPPRVKDVRTFTLDTRESKLKRDELVDRLIGSPEFIDFWSNKWSDLLQVNPKFLGGDGAGVFRRWVRQSVASDMPYDEFVHTILTAEGSTFENPPASYFKILDKPEDIMENTTQLFLGIRFSCNKCHDHPFERWTQRNYWELASYFAHVGRKTEAGKPGEVVFDKPDGEVESPYPGGVEVSFPYEHKGYLQKDKASAETTRRQTLATWLTSTENPYFARSFVNRLWSYFLGLGFIDPVDDIRAGNPPSNPELLDRMTADFIASGFDTRKFMRLICNSRVYRQSIQTNEWNEDDKTNFSHALARRLPAETLYDAIHVATGSLPHIPGKKGGLLAVEVSDPSVKIADGFLDLFGRPPRESACECERTNNVSLGQAISLVNGPTVANALNDPHNAIARLAEFETDGAKIIEELFLMFLGRHPTAAEQTAVAPSLDVNSRATCDSLSPTDRTRIDEEVASFIKDQTEKLIVWQPLDLTIFKSTDGAAMTKKDDGSILITGDYQEEPLLDYTVVGWTDVEDIRGIKLEVLPDAALPTSGPGRQTDGNFFVVDFRVSAVSATDPGDTKVVKFSTATADFREGDNVAQGAIDEERNNSGWSVLPQVGRAHEAWIEASESFGWKGGTVLTITIRQLSHLGIGRFRLWLTNSTTPIRWVPVSPESYAALIVPADQHTDAHKSVLYRHYLSRKPQMAQLLRLSATRDLAWALVNSPAFLFNR
jgi:hypothetical protein